MSDLPEIAVFGGSFDPPHLGHVLLASYALSMTRVERVLVVPVFEHAFGKALSDFDQRLAMCELAFQDLKRVEISDHERKLGGISRTLRLVHALREAWPHHRLRLLVGTDILAQKDAWQSFDEICAHAPLLVAGRGGYDRGETDPRAPVLPPISSTEVRATLARGEDVSLWVPERVRAHIAAHGLYEPGSAA
jgi:nicotinate-nucleotide adenylyltransferase